MGRFAHPKGRRLLCSCAPALGFAFLPKCPLCLAAGLAWLGISIPISRSFLTFLLLCVPVGFLFAATFRSGRLAAVCQALEYLRKTVLRPSNFVTNKLAGVKNTPERDRFGVNFVDLRRVKRTFCPDRTEICAEVPLP
jgi:hypothetical protein